MISIDLIIIIAFLIAGIMGFIKGFILSLTSLLGWWLGLYASFRFATLVSQWLQVQTGQSPSLTYILAFIICFTAAVGLAFLVGKTIQKVIEIAALGLFNRLAGALFGILKISLFLSALIYLVTIIDPGESLITAEKKEQSVFYRPLSGFMPAVLPFMRKQWELIDPRREENNKSKHDETPNELVLNNL